jgi:dTDP-glucose 4,6-dehydratase
VILVTGGSGFIGSNFVLTWLAETGEPVINLDKLTYAGNPENLAALAGDERYVFTRGDINDRGLLRALFTRHRPRSIVHFAAESHVDRSIAGPEEFIRTNVTGTFSLLEEARAYWSSLDSSQKQAFRFLHVSTDEVYGSLGPRDPAFTETTPYAPNSPYSASKAAADHLVRAYHHTYGLPTLITNCSNNFGPRQFPEKLIPLMIINALRELPLPVYGDGLNVRDWLYVTDHCAAIRLVLEHGRSGDTYNVGGDNELTNLDLIRSVISTVDTFEPPSGKKSRDGLITFVRDRAGHDRRYAMDSGKIRRELGWRPCEPFSAALQATVRWYLDNRDWVQKILSGEYQQWIVANYEQRERA